MSKNSLRVKKQPVYRYGIEIVRPWSQEMYIHNEKVLEEAKRNIRDVLAGTNCTQKICEAITGYRFGHGYSFKDILYTAQVAVEDLQFFMVPEVYSDLQKLSDIPPLSMEIIGYETPAQLNELRETANEQEVIKLGKAILIIQEANDRIARVMGARESYLFRVGTQPFERLLFDLIKELGYEHNWRSVVKDSSK